MWYSLIVDQTKRKSFKIEKGLKTMYSVAEQEYDYYKQYAAEFYVAGLLPAMSFAEYVEFELKRGVLWICGKQSQSKLTGEVKNQSN